MTIRSRSVAATVTTFALLWSGCSSLTDVKAPDVLEPDRLNNPAGANALRAGAITRFTEAMINPTLEYGQIGGSGMISDEFTSTFTNRLGDRRSTEGGASEINDPAMQLARVLLLDAIKALQQFAPSPASRIGHLFALLGYTELFIGENMCSGVPLSAIVDNVPVYGEPLTTEELFEQSLADLDSALIYAADSARILNLARLGRGRTLLNLGRYVDAAAAVANVPTTYSFTTQHSSSAQQNGFALAQFSTRSVSVADGEGTNGLNFRTAGDPRVPTQLIGIGADGVTPAYAFTRYNTTTSSVPFANGIEARLIEAEAAFQADPNDASTTGSGWLGILNALRSTAITPAMAPLADPGSPDARVDLLFRERAFWLFGTGHRHGDLRRLIRQYGRAVESVFPTGPYRGGLVYGTSVTYVPSAREANNPHFNGCISLGA